MFTQKTLTYLLLLLPLFVQAQPATEVTFEKKKTIPLTVSASQ